MREFDEGDMLTQQEVASLFGVTPATVRKWMRPSGHEGKPQLRYVRPAKQPLFSRLQIAAWLRSIQEQVDPQMVDVHRATREQGNA